MTAPALTRAAAAKINLTLEVTGRRSDGYHTLESLVAFTDIEDHLTFSPASEVALDVRGPEASALTGDESNLAVKAARLVQRHLNTTDGVAIALEKRIPLAAGLGGGSADAAATVDACMTLWAKNDQPAPSDDALAFELGADVPVCRFGQAAMMRGIGEQVSGPVQLPPAWVLLANPGVSVPTKDVFAAFPGDFCTGTADIPDLSDFSALIEFLRVRQNSLTGAAISIAPDIGRTLAALGDLKNCAAARMSGSGATCFGLFASQADADHGATVLADAYPAWWIRVSALKR